MSVGGCPHGYSSVGSCYDCMLDGPVVNLTQPKEKPEETIDRYYPESMYDGQCRECNLPIHIGQPIYRMTNGDDKWYIHADCIT